MKTTTRMLKILLLVSAVFLTSNQMIAQTNTSPTQTVCVGSLAEPYLINPPTSGSTYQWTLTGGGTIVTGQGTNAITIDWGMIPGGPHTLSVIETDASSCPGTPITVDVTVNSLDDATFTLTDYCDGSANSATVTGTLGGIFTFTAPSPTGGETIDPLTGEITGGIAGTTYSVTYTTPTGPCSQTSTQTVMVNPLPITGPINHW